MSKPIKNEEVSLRLPQVDRVLREPALIDLSQRFKREILAQLVRGELDKRRRQYLQTKEVGAPSPEEVAMAVAKAAEELLRGGVRRVVNGTGVILNTNLGRAPMPPVVLHRLLDALQGYTSLEIDVESGKRGERTASINRLLSLLTGCQAAIVVNNNASAVMLAVSAMAHGREVVVSRGELIEIGGSFRLPDVITKAGGILKEVGTTNRTRASDFAGAVSEKTGFFLRCHRSNFQISGFTEEPQLGELVELARKTGIPLVEDLGSGALFDVSKFGLAAEPTVDCILKEGVDLVMFSGDKLLGGPQAGIIAGRKDLVELLRKNPLYRALRADKLIIALIETVLMQYLSPEPESNLPVISLASIKADELKARVQAFITKMTEHADLQNLINLSVAACRSALGGGSTPGKTLASFALVITPACEGLSAESIAFHLRAGEPPIISLIQDEHVLIDFRTILQSDIDKLASALLALPERISTR